MQKETINPTYGIAIKFWWANFWRSICFSLIVGSMIGIFLGIYRAVSKISTVELLIKFPIIWSLIFIIVGNFVSIYVMKKLLNKKFKTFSIYTVENTTDTLEKTEA